MKFQSKILAIGESAGEFQLENILIFFGHRANGGLEDYSVIIQEPESPVSLKPGDTLSIGDQEYPVTAVGDKVNETFSTLGHCTVRFDGADTPVLPGSLHVSGAYPLCQVGDVVTIR
ncbi:MAG: PTS glucitol/sorbitol transporter subunit IIA [Blautia sp.]